MSEPGRHIRLKSRWLLKRWLLVLPILESLLVAVLLSFADSPAAYLLVVLALVGGAVSGLVVLPVGEGRAAPAWLLILVVLLWLPAVSVVVLVTGVVRAFVVGCVYVALIAHAIVAAIRIVRRRDLSWRQIVTTPWRPWI